MSRASLAAVLCFLFSFSSLFAADPRIVYASTSSWETDLVITGSATSSVRATYSNCTIGAPNAGYATAPAGGAALVENFGAQLCGERIGTSPIRLEGAGAARVTARYRDAQGYVATFTIPALLDALPDPLTARGVRNDAAFRTDLALFNVGAKAADVTITVYDATGTAIATETVRTTPGKLTFHPLQTAFAIGRIDLSSGSRFGCVGCSGSEPVYGFASVSARAGGSPEVIAFERQ